MGRQTARIVLVVFVIALVVVAWLARGLPGPVHRFYNEWIAAFLGIFALLMVAWPLSDRQVWRRSARFSLPLAVLSGAAAVYWVRASTAEPTRTLVYGGVLALALGLMILVEWLRKRRR